MMRTALTGLVMLAQVTLAQPGAEPAVRTDPRVNAAFKCPGQCLQQVQTSLAGQKARYTCGRQTMIRLLTRQDDREIQVCWVYEGAHLIYSEKIWRNGMGRVIETETLHLSENKLTAWHNSNNTQPAPGDPLYLKVQEEVIACASKIYHD